MRCGWATAFYPSGCDQPGLVGMARVASTPYPGLTRFDTKSPYCDAKSKPQDPRWLRVDVKVLRKIRYRHSRVACRCELRELVLLRRGNRLSITPVEARHRQIMVKTLDKTGFLEKGLSSIFHRSSLL